jgi:hypothetical protein
MDEKTEKILSICSALGEIGEKEMANQLFEKVSEKIKFIKKDDWINHQICGDFPEVDIRCLVFCCSPAKNCPFRNSVLKKIGLTVMDYTKMKERFAEEIKR